MRDKRKMHFLLITYIFLTFLSLCGLGYTFYYTINALINNIGVLWVNIVVMSTMLIVFIYSLVSLVFIKKTKAIFTLSIGMFLVVILFLLYTVQIVFDFLGVSNSITIYFQNNITLIIATLTILMLTFTSYIAVILRNLYKQNKKEVVEISEVPTYDEELMLKKQLNDLNRKVEMKKISDKIEEMKKELEE